MTATRDQFFKPGRISAEAKIAQTNVVVRDILNAEISERAKKTERLRALRVAQEQPTGHTSKQKTKGAPRSAKG